MIVVDANILVGFMCMPAHQPLAGRARTRDACWVLPPLWKHEFLNAIALLVRHRHFTAADAAAIWIEGSAAFEPNEHAPDLAAALHLALVHGITTYDAQYVVLAEMLNVPLLTEDRELLRKFPRRAVSLETFCGGTRTGR